MMRLLTGFALLLLFLAVSMITFALMQRGPQPSIGRRLLRGESDDWRRSVVGSPLLRPVFALLALLIPFSVPREASKRLQLRARLLQAGLRGDQPVRVYYGTKSLLALLVFAVLGGMLIGRAHLGHTMVLLLLLCGLAFYTPDLYLNWKVKTRRRMIFEGLPDALDLIRICVGSGLGLDAAILRVGQELEISNRALSQEFTLLNAELRARVSREEAMRNMAARIGIDDVNALVTMLIQSERFGTSVTDALKVYAVGLRDKRMLQAEELAAKIPAKLSIPMILCIFPALFIVILGPSVLHIMQVLHLGGQ